MPIFYGGGTPNMFVEKVQTHRQLSAEEAKEVSQGQLLTGEQAKELKLVDEIGGFYDVVDDLSKAVHIKGAPELIFFRPAENGFFSFLRYFFR